MPFKDSDYNRNYQRKWAAERRAAKLAAKKAAHPFGPLGYDGELLIVKWVKHGEALLNNMIAKSNWQKEHQEELRIYHTAWREENREHHRKTQNTWANTHPTYRACQAQWSQEHPEVAVAIAARRRALLLNVPINDLTHAQWLEIQAAYDHRCVYCGKRRKGKLTQDHIIPLSKGGSHTASNVVPACKSCNSRKHNKGPLIPVQPLLLTLAPSRPPKAG